MERKVEVRRSPEVASVLVVAEAPVGGAHRHGDVAGFVIGCIVSDQDLEIRQGLVPKGLQRGLQDRAPWYTGNPTETLGTVGAACSESMVAAFGGLFTGFASRLIGSFHRAQLREVGRHPSGCRSTRCRVRSCRRL